MSGLLLLLLILYVLSAGVVTLGVVRPALMDWYNSKTYWVSGSDRTDIFLKLIGSKVSFEAFAFVASCIVGALGGWIYAMRKNRISV